MQRAREGQIFVLLAPGFEESDVTIVTRTLRRMGLPVVLVGLTAGPLRGAYGLSLAPDRTLSEVQADQPHAVVLPGGVQAARQLNADPRVHALVRQVVDQEGYVMALDTAYMVLYGAGVLSESGKEPAGGSTPGWYDPGLTSERVSVNGRVIFGCESGAAQESALALAALLDTEWHGQGAR